MQFENLTCCLLVVTTFFHSCKSQTIDEQIKSTADKAIAAIQHGDSEEFQELIGVKLDVIGKNSKMIAHDVSYYDSLFRLYYRNKTPSFEVTKLYDAMGQMLVRIPIASNLNGAKPLQLNLLFGPPNIVPLSKISGYELVENNSDSSRFHSLNTYDGH